MSRQAWWLGAALLLLLLSAGSVGVALALVDASDYAPLIVAAVQRTTGRTLTLGGPLHITRSLWPTIKATDVKLANLPGGTRPDMARAESIEAQLSLLALLHGHIEVSQLTLVGPNILFEQVDNQPNWVFKREPASPTASSGQYVALDIRSAQVRNGMVTIRLPTRTHVLGIRALDLHHPVEDGSLDFMGTFVYSDYQPFVLRASAQPADNVAGSWNTQLEFAADDGMVSAAGLVNLTGDYDLQVHGRIPDLGRFNALLPPLRLPSLHRVDFSTRLISGRAPGDLPVIGETRLSIGAADLGDRVPGLTLGAVEASLPTVAGVATVTGAGRYADSAFTFAGTFGAPGRLDGRVSTPITLTAQVNAAADGVRPSSPANGSLVLKGKLALAAGDFDGLDATVGLRLPALAAWQPVLSYALPALTDVSLGGQLVVPAGLGSLRLNGATLSAHEVDLVGDAAIGFKPVLALDGRLRATSLDLDALLTASGAVGSPPAVNSAATGRSGTMIPHTPLPWAMLRGKTMNLSASVAAMTFRHQVWHNLDFAMRLAAGQLQLGQLKLAAPQGPIELSLSADASQQEVPVSLTLHAPGIPLALLAFYADLPGDAAGTLDVETQLKAHGRSASDLFASLEGPFAATMTDGHLSNAALVKLASTSLQALGNPSARTG